MGQPIEKCRRHPFISENLRPVGEIQIRGDPHAGPFVTFREELEEELRRISGERQIPQLVDQDQVELAVLLEEPLQAEFLLGQLQFLGQSRGRTEEHAVALKTGRTAQGNQQVGFAETAVADKQQVFVPGDEGTLGQFHHPGLRDRGHGGKVEVLEPLLVWEGGLFQPAFELVFIPLDDLLFQEGPEVVEIVGVVLLSLPGARFRYSRAAAGILSRLR